MNAAEAQAVNRLLNHLAGSIVLESSELEDDIALLIDEMISATGIGSALDVEAVLETLAEVGGWHCHGDPDDDDLAPYEPEQPDPRPVRTAKIGGDVL